MSSGRFSRKRWLSRRDGLPDRHIINKLATKGLLKWMDDSTDLNVGGTAIISICDCVGLPACY